MITAEVKTREQYTFQASASRLACILTQNVAAGSKVLVNVVAFSITPAAAGTIAATGDSSSSSKDELSISTKNRKKQLEYLVKIVVGTDDPNTTDRGGGPATNQQQNARFRDILTSFKISFKVSTVVQLFNLEALTGTAGAYRVFLVALLCAGIAVRASYQGEPARLLAPPPLPACQTGVVTAIFEVPKQQAAKALEVLRALDLRFPEAQLCLNTRNVGEKCQCKRDSAASGASKKR